MQVRPNRIRDLRLERKNSQIQLAVAAGLSLITIRMAETGIASPRTLTAVARALDVAEAELFPGRSAQSAIAAE
ncbi:MAG: helix-turn-helix transcriptional regulator [Myxococcaceae bacterium]